MPGLDPGIHDEQQRAKFLRKSAVPNRLMDCRVKPGNDDGEHGTPRRQASSRAQAAQTLNRS
jgi:hypothetical protein